ncbi:putative protein N(5)-glutamine methyltransferase [Saccharopolyspora sp. WRP15-2]|uniref:peptide chain release factor N(5)-glutamine methyltransferase n=1 Tax=Saccharopolyspora oryzae TaxID=2997343 RepID=A0ABT4V0Y7_9PSEU|nr:putative protein N(5)-glutamine methyltransferase [Saccharopolyspora oryzae]MDA3627626.1 putative protein N(5)-glutamine methyltransferase [Saccharopolyspora oryzae]
MVAALRSAGCVFAEDEAALLHEAAHDDTELAELVRRRVSGLPLEQVLGWAEFCGLRISLSPGVFVPRRRTEFLAEQAIALTGSGPVVELCCGAGAVAAAVLVAHPSVELYAADVDPAAVSCAAGNLPGAAGVVRGDLYRALPDELRGRVEVVVANAPYVPTGEVGMMPPEARLHEPAVALDGGADGLDIQRRVAAEAPRWLAPGGNLLIETSRRQAPGTAALFTEAGLLPRILHCEERDATVVAGTRPR